ncbi:MAG: carboxypeptidase regulatory-like domain-containing protein [Blastocatellia bacterium]
MHFSTSPLIKRVSSAGVFLMAMIFSMGVPSATALAQATTGTIRGTVEDQNGAVVPNASVVAKNQATGVSSPTYKTTNDGVFVIPGLIPGVYTVMVESSNFKKAVYTDLEVRLGQDTALPVDLKPGGVTEQVTVTAAGEQIQSETAQISASFETRKVQDLPSNAAGGGIDTLALLAPGIVPGFGNVNQNGVTLSVNGNRARSNNFTLDGTDNNDLTIGGPSLFVTNQELVQEFQVVTNNFSAQYGRNQGAVVNIVTKSGTNDIHGSAFEYHRNAKSLDALTNFQRRRGDKDPPFFLSNVFGGTVGGPIKKDKIFYFGSYQGVRQRSTFNADGNLAILPAEFSRLSAAIPGNDAIATYVKQSPFALTKLGSVYPRRDRTFRTTYPNSTTAAPAGSQDFININGVDYAAAFVHRDFAANFDSNEYSIRGDANVTEKNSINARYIYQKTNNINGVGSVNGFSGNVPANSRNLSGSYDRQINSRSVNQFRATYQKLSVLFGGGCEDTLSGCILDPKDIDKAFTNITFGITGSLTRTGLQTIGPATNLPQGRIVEVYQFSDNFSYTLGRHQMVMGADIRRLINSVPFLPNINGAFRFANAARFAANAPTQVILGAGEPRIKYTETDNFYFFQDDWKIRDNFVLNLGIRYENTGQPINILNELSTAREGNSSSALYRQNIPIEGRTVPGIPTDSNNWAPRFGFAYTPKAGNGWMKKLVGEQATVIRGGYSIAYDPGFYNIHLNVSTSAPSVFLNTIVNNADLVAPTFRLPASPTGDVVRSRLGSFLQRNTFDPRLLNQTIVGGDFRSPYSQQWSFGIQRQINRNHVAEVRYVGNHGVGLFQSINRNPFLSTLATGFTSPGFGQTSFTFPGFASLLGGATPLSCTNDPATPDNEGVCNGRLLRQGLIRSRENTAQSNYHGLQMRYNGQIYKTLTLGVSYTYSKAIDNASEIFGFGEGAFAANALNIGRPERSLSGFDRRHAYSLNFIYDVPLFKDQKGFLGKVLGGYQLNGTYVIASGRRATPSQFYGFGLGLPSYQDNTFQATFAGLDGIRPWVGNPKAAATAVGITDVDASFYGFLPGAFQASPTGYYSLNELNSSGKLVAVKLDEVQYVLNGPGAAQRFGNPFGNAPRNSLQGARLNHPNFGIFKNTKFKERYNVQFRAEFFNVFNHPNAGYGVAAGATLYDNVIEDAGVTFNDRREVELSSRRIQFGLRFVF